MRVRCIRLVAFAFAALVGGAWPLLTGAQGKPNTAPPASQNVVTPAQKAALNKSVAAIDADRKRRQKAIAQFDAALKLHKANRVEAAIAAYTAYLPLAKEAHLLPGAFAPAWKNLAALYDAKHDAPNETRALTQVVHYEPNNVAALTQLATLMQARRKFPEARAYALRALQQNPTPNLAAALHFTLGAVYAAVRDWPNAEREFSATVKLVPDNALAQYNYALALGQRRRFSQALAAAQIASKLAPGLTQARLYIASLEQQMGRSGDALARYDALLKTDPHNAQALFSRALLLQKAGKVNEALAAYRQVETENPKDAGAQLNIGQLYYGIGNYTAAQEHFARARTLLPHDARPLSGLALCEMQTAFRQSDPKQREQQFRQAETHFKESLARNPKNVTLEIELAQMYARVGRLDDAIAVYRKREQAEPDNREAVSRLAQSYLMKRQTNESLAVWQRYQARKPNDPAAHDELARLYEITSRYPDAIEERRKQLALAPTEGGARLTLANDYAQNKQMERAKTEYLAVADMDAQAKELPPATRGFAQANRQQWRRQAWRSLSQLAEEANNITEAAAYLNKIKADQAQPTGSGSPPADAQIYFDLADLYQRHNQPAPARQELIAATNALPNNAEAFTRLAQNYAAQHQTDDAALAYRRAMAHSKDPLGVGLLLAEMYRRDGKPELALAEYDALSVQYPRESRLLAAQGQALEAAGQDARAYDVYVALGQADKSLNWVEDRRAIVLTRLKRFDEARALRETQIDRAPDLLEPYADLARIYKEEGKPDAYRTWLEARVAHAPTRTTPMGALLNLYAEQGREAEGWKFLRGIAAQHPGERSVQEAYALLLAQRGKRSEAIPIYRQIARANPDEDAPFRTLIEILEAEGKPEATNAEYADFLKTPGLSDAQRVNLRRELATRFLNQNNFADAIVQYRELLKARPNDLNAQVLLAQTLARNGQKPEAAAAYNVVLNRTDCPPGTRVYCLAELGQLLEQQGNKTDAVTRYREALKLDPNYPQASDGLKRLGG